MAIIRSKIARQLLAEGGAPRVPFRSGGREDAESQYGSGSVDSYSYSEPTSVSGPDQEDDNARMMSDMGLTPSFGPDRDDDDKALSYVNFNRPQQTPSFFQKSFDTLSNYTPLSLFNKLDQRFLKPSRDKYNLSRRTDFLRKEGVIGPGEEDEKYTDEFLLSPEGLDMLKGMGYTTIQDVINKGEGGDNEPIRKLKAPITEKKEEPKDEFDDILKFYGARFARGGRTDAESQYGIDSVGSYSYADDGNRDDGGGPPAGPPTFTGGGEPEYVYAGIGKGKGLTPQEISILNADILNEYYGTPSRQEEVLGPLGTAPSGLMGAGPSVTFGQEVTKGPGTTEITGATVTQPTGFTVDNIADTIFDKGSLGGKARDALRSNKSNVQSLRDRFDIPEKADGGAIRQNYGLGSIVKKIGRTVKKIAKSPIGKAALIGGLGYLGATKTGFGSGLLESFKAMSPIKKALLIGGTAATLSPFAMKDEEEEELPAVSNTDPEFQKYLAFYGGPRRFAEGGGDIDEAPMESMPRQEMASKPSSFAELNMLSLDLFGRPYDQLNDSEQEILMEYFSKSKDMPERTMAAGGGMMNPNDEMLNLGGNEMDLRGGGFVPLGEYEKKDDVPARLSKNEFVFTADAVRAAGGGSVDRGADLMYKTMKQLENKVV